MKMQNGIHNTADHQEALVGKGLDSKVAEKFQETFESGKLTFEELDDRAISAIKAFVVADALNILKQFQETNLQHVSNKSAYLCGIMKSYTQKKQMGEATQSGRTEPDPQKINEILKRTGYTLDVSVGQRKYGGPPPNWTDAAPSGGCEIYCGKLCKEVFEDDLIPLFEKFGKIYDLRLMLDPLTGINRGFCFVTYTNTDEAKRAQKELDGHELKGKKLQVNISIPNCRLFIGNIPKSKDKEEILAEFSKHADGIKDAIIYTSPNDNKKNRGFCFLEFDDHKTASMAKKKIGAGRIRFFNCEVICDWADTQEDIDSEVMSKVKVLFIKNLAHAATEEKLRELLTKYGPLEKLKKMKDYAFAFFEEREHAVNAMNALNNYEIGGANMDITLAKPLMDKKKRDDMLRKREIRTQALIGQKTGNYGGMRGMRGGYMRDAGPGNYGPPPAYGYDGYGYGGRADYMGGYCSDPYYDDYGYYEGPRGGNRGGYGRGMPPPAGRGYGRGGPMMPPYRGLHMFGMKGGRGMAQRGGGNHRAGGDYGFR